MAAVTEQVMTSATDYREAVEKLKGQYRVQTERLLFLEERLALLGRMIDELAAARWQVRRVQ